VKSKHWLTYAIVTTISWGVWGALIEIPEKGGFPATLGYVVWALTMLIPAYIVLKKINFKIEKDKKSIFLGLVIGITGAGGQIILFQALVSGPAYLVFPIISLSPVITIMLSLAFLKEKANARGWIGITLALIAIFLFSYSSGDGSDISGYVWIILSLLVFLAWGFQGFVMKFANETMKAESIFFYMTLSGLLLIPFAIWMTDFSLEINWGLSGPYLTAVIQILNSIGALMLVYAFRYGKAIVVSPLVNAVAPIITVVLSLVIYQVIPSLIVVSGIVLAITSVFLLAIEEDEEPTLEGKEQ